LQVIGRGVLNVLEGTTVKAPQRSAILCAGLAAALAVTTVPSIVSAQRQQVPGPDTKQVLVTTFRGDVEGGVRAANEIRDRISSEFSIRQLMPTSKKLIDTTLVNSGYKPDSALSPNDIKELARIVRGDEVIDGTVTKTATGYRLNARMFLARDAALSQPLVTNLETNNLGDAAKQVVAEYDLARKQIPDNQACENGIRANTPAVAMTAARHGIANYPKATIARLCLASSYAAMKTTADSTGPWKDSVIAITKIVIDLDNVSRIAYQFQIDAYKQMHDTTNLVQALLGYMSSDPTNATLREQVIVEVIKLGKANLAVPIAKTLVAENPGDPGYLKTYWLVLRTATMFKESVPVGESIAAMDTSAADTLYFMRQIQDLVSDSGYARAAVMAAAASAKFPNRTDFLIQKAQYERRTNQLPAAKASIERALQIDPKVNGANYLLAQIAGEVGNADDAIKYAKADVAADPANKTRASGLLLPMGQIAYKSFAASKKPEDYKKAMDLLKASDEINPSAAAKFFMAVSAFAMLQVQLETLPKSKSCDEFKGANDLLTIVNMNMPSGGAYNPDVAKQILGGAAQFGPFIDGSIKKFCK
jgi:tetratricopeptide (TPR) repeat protein